MAEQTFSGSGGRVDHVLAVVEDDDHLAVADRVDEKLGVGHVQRRCDRRGNPRRIADRRELDEVAAVREVARRRSCDLQREPGLSDTTRTDEGDEPLLGCESDELAKLVVATDERRQRFGERAATLRTGGVHPTRRGRVEGLVVRQDRGLQPAKLRPRLES